MRLFCVKFSRFYVELLDLALFISISPLEDSQISLR